MLNLKRHQQKGIHSRCCTDAQYSPFNVMDVAEKSEGRGDINGRVTKSGPDIERSGLSVGFNAGFLVLDLEYDAEP